MGKFREKVEEWLNDRSLRVKMRIIYLVCVLLPIIITDGAMFMTVSRSDAADRLRETENTADAVYYELVRQVEISSIMAANIAANKSIREYLDKQYKGPLDYFVCYDDFKTSTLFSSAYGSGMFHLTLYSDNDTMLNGGVFSRLSTAKDSYWYYIINTEDLNALLAYIVSRKDFLFKSELSLFWVITMYVNGGLIPVLLLYKNLHLLSTFWVYIIPGAVSAFNMLVMRTYMLGIPEELEESAKMDGAGYFTIFIKIISPLCKPVYATVALFVAVGHWNSWFDAMLYNRNKVEYTTLQYELMKLLSSAMQQSGTATGGGQASTGNTVTPITIRSAATIATMAPIIMLYPFLQRYFVTGLTLGGVKG